MVPPPAADGTAEAAKWHRRADAATEALLSTFWSQAADYFTFSAGGSEPAGYWNMAQALDVVLDALERTHDSKYADTARALYQAQDRRGWSRNYFDDENWMALALLRAHDLTGDPEYHDRAVALFEDIMANGWDKGCCGAPSGVWWDRAHTQKATPSNAGPVITGVRLQERTGDPRYLDFARKVYDHWLSAMVDPATGQVADHVTSSGEKVWWRFTYNEGTMIGAGLALYGATGAPKYLDDARRISGFVLARETGRSASGAVLSDGPDCKDDCEQFKGIAHRYLSLLAAMDSSLSEVRTLLRANAESLWELAREPKRNLFATDWAGPPPASGSLAAQISAAMALNLFASSLGIDSTRLIARIPPQVIPIMGLTDTAREEDRPRQRAPPF